mgnify:CR=1 FL=1
MIHLLCQEIHAIILKRDCRIMAGYFRLIPALRHPSFTQRKNSVFLCTRICGAGTNLYCLWRESVFNRSVIICAGTENIPRRRCISDRLHSFTGEYRCSDLGSARQRHARCILSGKSRPGRRKELVSLFQPVLQALQRPGRHGFYSFPGLLPGCTG